MRQLLGADKRSSAVSLTAFFFAATGSASCCPCCWAGAGAGAGFVASAGGGAGAVARGCTGMSSHACLWTTADPFGSVGSVGFVGFVGSETGGTGGDGSCSVKTAVGLGRLSTTVRSVSIVRYLFPYGPTLLQTCSSVEYVWNCECDSVFHCSPAAGRYDGMAAGATGGAASTSPVKKMAAGTHIQSTACSEQINGWGGGSPPQRG